MNLENALIYGYSNRVENEYGLLSLKEVSFCVPPAALRAVAKMLEETAHEIENGNVRKNWHRHCPEQLALAFGAELVVIAPEGSECPAPNNTIE